MGPRRRPFHAAIALAAACLLAACGDRSGRGAAAREGARTVVLVTVDTLRRDHVGAFALGGRALADTPRMDGLARAGTVFADARTPVPLTLPAHVTMMCGLPPAVHGVRSNTASRVPPPSDRRWRLVAETLAASGRCCGAFVSAGPLVARYGLDQGFHVYDDGGLGDMTGGTYAERPGSETVARALAWVRGLPADRRVFLWVHLFEPHEPHARDYRSDVEEADAIVGALLDGLSDAGRGDAAVVLAADHGEALGELGEATHGFLLGESVLRVPLVVRAPAAIAPGVRRDPVDLADVGPTLLALAGVAAPPVPDVAGRGRDLLEGEAPADRARVAETLHGWHQDRWAQLSCGLCGPWKIEDRGGGGIVLLRLRDEGPPWQEGAVPAAGRAEATAPAAALRAYRRGENRTRDEPGTAPGGYGAGGAVGFFLDPAENARLPDPYAVIEDVKRLGQAAAALLATPPLPGRIEAALAQLETLARRAPADPSVAFWRGRGLRALARHAEALASFERAYDLGRVDADTVLLALRSAVAAGRPKAGLDLLERARASLPPDRRVDEAEAEAWMAAGEPGRAAQARERARQPLPTPARAPDPGGCR